MKIHRRSKYGVSAKSERTTDGITFDSKSEMTRWLQLILLERLGKISNLKRQISFNFIINDKPLIIRSQGFPNGRKVSYRADFSYEENGETIIEDRKGMITSEAKLKLALMEAVHGIKVRITK